MAFQRVPNTAEITFVYQQNLQPVVNTTHAVRAGGYNGAQIINLAAAMDAVAVSNLRPAMVTDAFYLRAEIRGLDQENDLAASNADGAGAGALLGPGLPNNVTLSIKRASPFTGRSARGRWFWVGLAAAQLSGNENEVDEQAVLDAQFAVDAVRLAIQAEGWSPVIVSRFTNKLQRAEGVTFNWVDTVAVNGSVDSQRGRLA